MNTKNIQLVGTLLILLCVSSTAFAEKAPLSAEALASKAEAIVVATIKNIRIESESSTLEPGFGNSDWGIYLTLNVESVEKGQVTDGILEARCFRVKTRRSAQEYLSPSGHQSIPEIGTRVRVYLEERDGSWHIVLPNGIAADRNGQQSSEALADAKEVSRLRSIAYTFILPVEVWIFIGFIGLAVLAFFGWRLKRKGRMLFASGTNSAV